MGSAIIDDRNEKILFKENIRLVIWDLDETFWQGTITEGGIIYNDNYHRIVVELAQRGIMSSICSKNDHHVIESILKEKISGITSYFRRSTGAQRRRALRIRSKQLASGLLQSFLSMIIGKICIRCST